MLHELRSMIAGTVVLSLTMIVSGCSTSPTSSEKGKGNAEKTGGAKVEMPKDFSLAKTWCGKYKNKTVTFVFAEDKTGSITLEGGEPMEFKWEEERPSTDRINAKVYMMKSSAFAKGSLKMYNSGKGFSMKMKYTADNEFTIYCGLYEKDGKVVVDDGPFTIKAK